MSFGSAEEMQEALSCLDKSPEMKGIPLDILELIDHNEPIKKGQESDETIKDRSDLEPSSASESTQDTDEKMLF